jgi:uncharacterized protein YbjT (DUF2867 family)
LSSALDTARPSKVVYLSTIGAQATHSNLLSQHTIIEQALRELSVPITFLRPGWLMENSAWAVAPAKNGVISSFQRPLDNPVPMVATADIGRTAAALLQETSQEKRGGQRVVELEGPQRVTPDEIAQAGRIPQALIPELIFVFPIDRALWPDFVNNRYSLLATSPS